MMWHPPLRLLNPKKGGGGKEESRVKWTRETDLNGAQFMFLALKATMFAP